ncbi:MAG: hypothetical protein A2X49_00780 [Lentisphaerae bacterium GWF2_52_8]|nr:MAG: hypothetical protein A2X49_00780 [Lentisphaerae bacterium GWF2_52_8]
MAGIDGLGSFSQAWRLLLDIPLPAVFRPLASRDGSSEEFDTDSSSSSQVLLSFPLVGAAMGLAAYLLAWLLLRFPGNPAAAFVFALAATIGLEMATSGRHLALLLSFLENRLSGTPTDAALLKLQDDFHSVKSPLGTLVLVTVFLLRIFCFGLLVYYERAFWVILALTGGFAVQAQLATMANLETRQPLLELPEERMANYPWFITAAIFLVAGFPCLPAALIGLILCYIIAVQARKYFEAHFGGITPNMTSLAGYLSEITLLITGIIFLVRPN